MKGRANKIRHGYLTAPYLRFAGFDPRHIRGFVDHFAQPVRFFLHNGKKIVLLRVMIVFGTYGSYGTLDRSQRGEKIVRERIEKGASKLLISASHFQSSQSNLLASMLDRDRD
jgi:hypothetical protein